MNTERNEEKTTLQMQELEQKMDSQAVIPSGTVRPIVKSTAIVKYSSVQSPASFTCLQCNTDLNLPPSNWMSSSAESYGLQHVIPHRTGFSSFRLAHMFPDCVGQVDVVSDAENIKKLLKLSYSRGPVSMMVHRVENTLLIDEFDIAKFLLQASSDWAWLQKFICDQIMGKYLKGSLIPAEHTRHVLKQNSLMSKFLHHSLVAPDISEEPVVAQAATFPVTTVPVVNEPPLPEPRLEEEVPNSDSTKHTFARNVVWTFEDIQMLLGTDMPIFGGGTHPCISLRLCDMKRPINVLTGIDYWLDNLMSNVPELVMCYHLEGIVQRYELVKTEDLPFMEGSKFSPKVIHDIAQNILSFLKANAAKAGHTYWLFKGRDDDVVKLYDLTSLCSDSPDENGQNPFTVPVAMLLYRVARNMKHSPDGHRQRGTIRVLLNNCVDLLDREKYPQIVTSAHYMLSDLYLAANTDPAAPCADDKMETEADGEECEVPDISSQSSTEQAQPRGRDADNSSSLSAIKCLPLRSLQAKANGEQVDLESPHYNSYTRPQPFVATVEERCHLALKHVAAGLQCLQFFHRPSEPEKPEPPEAQEPKMAHPFTPIPMPYAPLHENSKKPGKNSKSKSNEDKKSYGKKNRSARTQKNKEESSTSNGIKTLLCQSPPGFMPTWQRPDLKDTASWKAHLKILLYEKACLVYATLAEQAYASERFGRALQMISRVLRCRNALDVLLRPQVSKGLRSYLLGRAGDCCFMLVQNWFNVDTYRQELASTSEVDSEIDNEISVDVGQTNQISDLNLLPENIESFEQMLLASLHSYERAWELDPAQDNLPRRIGNVHNELGVLYMHRAAAQYHDLAAELAATESQKRGEDASDDKCAQAEEKKSVDKNLKVKDTSKDSKKSEDKPTLDKIKTEGEKASKEYFETLFSKSVHHLEAGVKTFEKIEDSVNLALLHSNTGRLLRLCAHLSAPGVNDSKSVTAQERGFYNKALLSYQKALQVLGSRKNNPDVWDTVTWEMSTALFNLASILQDCPDRAVKSPDEAERNVVDLLQRTLKFCDLETPGPRQPLYQFRAASVHHRLASLYHKNFRNAPNPEDRHARAVLQSCKLHYEKSIELLTLLEHPPEYLAVQMERVALCELQAQAATNFNAKTKAWSSTLELIVGTRAALALISNRSTPSNPNKSNKKKPPVKKKSPSEETKADEQEGSYDVDIDEEELKLFKEEERLLLLLEQRLQFILLTLTKLWQSKETNKKETDGNAAKFKQLYSSTLRVPGNMGSSVTLAKHLLKIIDNVEKTLHPKER